MRCLHLPTYPDLRRILFAIHSELDVCWWRFDSNGFRMSPRLVQELGPESDPTGSQAFLDHINAHVTIQGGEEIGRPGYPGAFSALADCVDFNWTVLFAVEANGNFIDPPIEVLTRLGEWRRHFFGPLDDLAAACPDCVLAARDIDSGYAELFFRDDHLFHRVRADPLIQSLGAFEVLAWDKTSGMAIPPKPNKLPM